MDGELMVMIDLEGRPGPTADQDVMKIPYDFLWEDLHLMLKLTFDCQGVRVRYVDDEQELVTISSQEELFEAFMVAKRNKDVLHLKVECLTDDADDDVVFMDADDRAAASQHPTASTRGVEVADGVSEMSAPESEPWLPSQESQPPSQREVQLIPQREAQDDVACILDTREQHSQTVPVDGNDTREQHSQTASTAGNEEMETSSDDLGKDLNNTRPEKRSSSREDHYVDLAREVGRLTSELHCVTEMPSDVDQADPDDETTPPTWFITYMEKFKQEIVEDISRLVSQHTVRNILRGLEGAVITTVESSSARKPATPPQPSTSSGSLSSDSGSPVYHHYGVLCDNCDKSIVGVRYKCGNCKDYDLCETCEAIEGIHPEDHVFIKLRRPTLALRRKKGVPVPLLRQSLYAEENREESYEAKLMRKLEKLTEKGKKKEEKFQKWAKAKEEKLKRKLDSSQSEGSQKKEKLDIPQLKASTLQYDGSFLGDVTIADGTVMAPGESFTKMWSMRNSGVSVWENGTKLKMLWGNFAAEETEVDVPLVVPGEDVILQVKFVAPGCAGTYQSHWRLCSPAGAWFGHRIWCQIIVQPEGAAEGATQSMETQIEATPEASKETQAVGPSSEEDKKQEDESTDKAEDDNEDTEIKKTATPASTPTDEVMVLSPMSELSRAMRTLSTSSSVELLHEASDEQAADHTDPQTMQSSTTSSVLSDRMAIKPPTMIEYSGESLCSISSQYSDSDSDSEFYIVPLPECFNTNLPMSTSTLAKHRLESDSEQFPENEKHNGEADMVVVTVDREKQDESIEMIASLSIKDEEVIYTRGTKEHLDSPEKETADSKEEDDSSEKEVESKAIEQSVKEPEEFQWYEPLETPAASLETPAASLETPAASLETPAASLETPAASLKTTPKEQMIDVEENHNRLPVVQIEQEKENISTEVPDSSAEKNDTTDASEQREQTGEETTLKSVKEEAASNEAQEGAAESDAAKKSIEQPRKRHSPTSPTQVASTVLTSALGVASQAASTAYSTARDVFHTLQARNQYTPKPSTWTPNSTDWTPVTSDWTPTKSTWTPSPSTWTPNTETLPAPSVVTPMDQLIDMGFADRELNKQMLEKHKDNVELAVTDILQHMDTDWSANRH